MKRIIATLAMFTAFTAFSTSVNALEVIAAGDIATSGTGDTKTSNLIAALNNHGSVVSRILTLGDNAYPNGSLSNFIDYYRPTWGRAEFFEKTYPSPGNHEYMTSGAQGYLDFFQKNPDALGSVNEVSPEVPGWTILQLDSNANLDGQNTQLANILAGDSNQCQLLYWHHPRYSSGEHGNDADVELWWDTAAQYGVDVILNGHDHNYERFLPQRGIVEFVVGMGGVSTRPFSSVQPNSAVRITGNDKRGVLDLELTPGEYTYQYRDATAAKVTGKVLDKSIDPVSCHS